MAIIADSCHHCSKKFKQNEHITIRDEKVFHTHCSQHYVRKQNIKKYKEKFSFLNERQIDNIVSTNHNHEKEFDKFNKYDWIVLLSLNIQEITVEGYDTKTQVEQFIVSHYKERIDANCEIDSLFYKKELYNYSIDINVTVHP